MCRTLDDGFLTVIGDDLRLYGIDPFRYFETIEFLKVGSRIFS